MILTSEIVAARIKRGLIIHHGDVLETLEHYEAELEALRPTPLFRVDQVVAVFNNQFRKIKSLRSAMIGNPETHAWFYTFYPHGDEDFRETKEDYLRALTKDEI